MGFKLGITTSTDTEYTDAYFKIQEVHYNLAGKRCDFRLLVYKDKAAKDAGKAMLKGVPTITNFHVRGDDFDTYFADSVLDGDGKNLMKQCYAYARAQDAYTDATDVDPDA